MGIETKRQDMTRQSARHYLEMVVVMLVGMAVLSVPAEWVWPGDDPTLILARMAATMTVPMVPWMLWRGHGWRPSLEMAGAMVVPSLGAIALAEAGVAVWLLMTVEHVAMLVAMFAVMIARPHEYSHGSGGLVLSSAR
jgi:hypothetical protein